MTEYALGMSLKEAFIKLLLSNMYHVLNKNLES